MSRGKFTLIAEWITQFNEETAARRARIPAAG
jgi:hypothetical protein